MQSLARCVVLMLVAAIGNTTFAQQSDKAQSKAPKPAAPFRWVNELKRKDLPNLTHHTFASPSLKTDVGYCIYLPSGYKKAENLNRRYPVVYYLHGGRPGSEVKSVSLVECIHSAQEKGVIPPIIYVFVNGGPVSHYNLPDQPEAQGKDVFVKELIPHIDQTYRTIADRNGRALEGFSQGGRGTARISLRHPQLFCSAAPGGGGHSTEKRISEENGYENPNLRFAEGDNTWDLARQYAQQKSPALRILVYVGNKGFNYENNLEWMAHLKSLGIPYERLIVDDAPHSATIIYGKQGETIMKFHAESFRLSGALN